MPRIAIYPGSFDPPTRGHEDLARRSLALADRVIVAVAINPNKAPLFTVEERLNLLREVLGDEPRFEFASFSGLMVDVARQRGATLAVRGLRAVSDFEYEFQMAMMNRHLNRRVETFFIAASEAYFYTASRLVKEVFQLGGDVQGLVPPVVERRLREKHGVAQA